MKAEPIDLTKVTNIDFDGIDDDDYPDYCDAYIISAYIDGVEATQEQLEELNDNTDFVYEKLMQYLH